MIFAINYWTTNFESKVIEIETKKKLILKLGKCFLRGWRRQHLKIDMQKEFDFPLYPEVRFLLLDALQLNFKTGARDN